MAFIKFLFHRNQVINFINNFVFHGLCKNLRLIKKLLKGF